MNPGAPDSTYVAARRVLLNALEVLGDLRESVILAGAQAVYLHVGEGDLAVAPFTTDADLALDPALLPSEPLLRAALARGGFGPNVNGQPGAYLDPSGIEVDLLVPERLAGGPGTRDARLSGQPRGTARRVLGLEGVLVDRDRREIGSLEEDDDRRYEVDVGGPAGLLVAKTYKLGERLEEPARLEPKDSLDCLRLLRLPIDAVAGRFHRLLQDPLSREIAQQSLEYLRRLYGAEDAVGAELAVRGAGPLENEVVIRASCVALAAELIRAVGG